MGLLVSFFFFSSFISMSFLRMNGYTSQQTILLAGQKPNNKVTTNIHKLRKFLWLTTAVFSMNEMVKNPLRWLRVVDLMGRKTFDFRFFPKQVLNPNHKMRIVRSLLSENEQKEVFRKREMSVRVVLQKLSHFKCMKF